MRQTTLSLALGVVFASSAFAETLPDFVGETVIVTATRTETTIADSLAAVSVITRADIERLQASSIQEVLAGQAGIAVANNGGLGKSTSVFMRGSNSDHVLVLIDGIKIGSATTGTAAFQDIPLEQVERIEIVRGPMSSLYGSEAIGGVIQIFTRKGDGTLRSSASVGYGTYNTRQAAANVSGGGQNSWFNIGANHVQTDGFNTCRGASAGCFANEPDKDGYRNTALNVRAGYRFQPGTELDVNFLRAQGENEFDGGSQNQSDFMQQVYGGALTHRINANWRVKLAAGQSRDESDNFKNAVYSSTFNTRRNSASMQHDLSLAQHSLLSLGIDYMDDNVSSSTKYAVTERGNTGVFAEYQFKLDQHALQLALRNDDNSQFGRHTTGNAAWGVALSDELRLTLAYGTAFKAPTFNQLYFPGFGNANLRPEQSRSIELGLAGRLPGGRWSVNLFNNRIKDLIAGFPVSNINQAEIEGVELSAKSRLADWDIAVNLTLQDPENQAAGANNGKVLPRRAQESLRIDLDRQLGSWRIGGTLRGEGERFDNASNSIKLDGYMLADLRAQYRLAKDWRVEAKLENLFDTQYETVYFYNQPGRGVYLTLRYQP